jgi:hypothetical protein
MGFWDVTKRMMQGKPAFEASPEDRSWDNDAPTDQPVPAERDRGLYDGKGYKHIPPMCVVRTKHHVNGNHCEVWVTIHNQSDRLLECDKIILCNVRTDLHRQLQPGGEWEFRAYNGPALTHDSYKKAELYYKDVPTGDYFRADHVVHYIYENDKTYSVSSMQLITPIYDI